MDNPNLNPKQMGTPFTPHFMVLPYKTEGGETGFSKIVSVNNRHHVVANIRGHRVPFYLSTGMAGKQTVEAGKWYPHFGIGEDGWINKGPEEAMTAHYGSHHLKKVADWLNTNVGDTTKGQLSLFGDESGVPVGADKGPHIKAINEGLSPVSRNGGIPAHENAGGLIKRVHYSPTMASKEDVQKDSQLHTLLETHAKTRPELNLGTNLP